MQIPFWDTTCTRNEATDQEAARETAHQEAACEEERNRTLDSERVLVDHRAMQEARWKRLACQQEAARFDAALRVVTTIAGHEEFPATIRVATACRKATSLTAGMDLEDVFTTRNGTHDHSLDTLADNVFAQAACEKASCLQEEHEEATHHQATVVASRSKATCKRQRQARHEKPTAVASPSCPALPAPLWAKSPPKFAPIPIVVEENCGGAEKRGSCGGAMGVTPAQWDAMAPPTLPAPR